MKISAFTVAPRAFSFVNSLLFVNMPCHLTSTHLQSRGLWCFPLLLYASAAARPLPLSLSPSSLSHVRAPLACATAAACAAAAAPSRARGHLPAYPAPSPAMAARLRAEPTCATLPRSPPARAALGRASASHGAPRTPLALLTSAPLRPTAASPRRRRERRRRRRLHHGPRGQLISGHLPPRRAPPKVARGSLLLLPHLILASPDFGLEPPPAMLGASRKNRSNSRGFFAKFVTHLNSS